MTPTLRVNIQPHEILFSFTEVVVESDKPLDARSAQAAILVRGQRGEVALSKDGTRASWSPLAPLAPGDHTLTVGKLTTRSGEEMAGDREIPFFITDSKAQVGDDLMVESMVRLAVHELGTTRLGADRRPEGPFIELMKASERATGAPRDLAFDQDGKAIDAGEIFAAIDQARADKYGKLHPSLYGRLEEAGDDTPIDAAIWLRTPESPHDRFKMAEGAPLETPPEVLEHRRQTAEVKARFVATLARQGVEGAKADRLAPLVYAPLTGGQIRELTTDPEVCGVFHHDTEGITDLVDSIAVARTDHAHNQGFQGSNIRVAVWEESPDDTTDLDVAAAFDPNPGPLEISPHARLTHAIIKNVETGAPHGHAPDCEQYSANSYSKDALAWAAEENCTVISQSFHLRDEAREGVMSLDDIIKDWMALEWPYPTIVQAAGNHWATDDDNISPSSSDEFVNHKGYNSLAVGNHDDDAGAMSGTSVFRNPPTSHGDRELPEICANGVDVTAVGHTSSGTSFAAPAVAGCAALLQEVNGTLRHWPEGCRAILLAGARRNVVDSTWWRDVRNNVDAADGSGPLDSRESVEIAKIRRTRNASGTQRGWDIGGLDSSDFGSDRLSTFSYRVRVPGSTPVAWRVKVALAWTSRLGFYITSLFPMQLERFSQLAVDLDLKIFDSSGRQVGYSGSWDNSYEIAEFLGVPGETYEIRIRRWSGTDDTTYGIAWGAMPWVPTFLQLEL